MAPKLEIEAVCGDSKLESVTLRNNQTDLVREEAIQHLFIFIRTKPGTSFLEGSVALDDKGFVKTGDMRSGSVKRVASAVGEGSVCVQFLHAVWGELP